MLQTLPHRCPPGCRSPFTRLLLTFSLGLAVAALAALPAGAQNGAQDSEARLDRGVRRSSTKVVLITDQALDPRLVTLEEGQLVAWMSYSKVASQVVFESETAKNMICHSLVNFSIVDDELKSAMIHPGEFASFCELKPGRYKYRIVREPSPTPDVDVARRRLEGEIVVGNPG